ncbi:MAG TPA: iron-sulfur cluster assembly scaffold protein [Gemmataceae bacterium]|nr:iron-sulfur cluster assembly scaffold protein [Gemmataceae bacterium]
MSRYSETLMDHFTSPRNNCRIGVPDRIGVVGRPGETLFMILYLRLQDGLVVEAMYQTNGCGASIAAGSVLTEMVKQRRVEECLQVTADMVTEALGGVPADRGHCPLLAITALRAALALFVKQTISEPGGQPS